MSEIKSVIVNGIEYVPKPAPEGKGEGWEIVAYSGRFWGNDGVMFKLGGHGLYETYVNKMVYKRSANELTEFGAKIHSVKRLSDGEVFSVKDDVSAREGEYCHWDQWYKIISMSVKNGTLGIELMNVIETNPTGSIWREIQNIKRVPAPKQPLFTTSDGKAVYEGDRYYWVDTDIWTNGWSIASTPITNPNYFNNHKMFYTPDESNEYILLNKPCLSVQDVMNRLNAYFEKHSVIPAFENIKLFAKSKIDKP